MQAVFRQRLTAGLELTANYTYSKSLTDDIGYYGTSNTQQEYYQQNYYDLKSEWGPAGSDIRHSFSATGTYNIPYGRGQKFGSNSNYVVNEILGGWKLSGSSVKYSGFPVTVTSNANYSSRVGAYLYAARPDQHAPVKIVNHAVDHWFGTDPSMIQACPAGDSVQPGTGAPCVYSPQSFTAFGDVRPGTLRAPGFFNVDGALEKSFPIVKEQQLQFRADFFNAFNIASYGNPDNAIADPNFGQITSTRSTERHIRFELKYAF